MWASSKGHPAAVLTLLSDARVKIIQQGNVSHLANRDCRKVKATRC